MKVEIVTPKILLSPCDGTREAGNQVTQKNWKGYHIYNVDDGSKSPDADLKEMQKGTSYHLVRGADTQRPTSVYGATRNTTRTELDYHDTKWIGSDIGSDAAISVLIHSMSGLKNSQGQLVTSDGGARQSNDADLGRTGTLCKAAKEATGGVATGRTSLAQMR